MNSFIVGFRFLFVHLQAKLSEYVVFLDVNVLFFKELH